MLCMMQSNYHHTLSVFLLVHHKKIMFWSLSAEFVYSLLRLFATQYNR